MTQKKVSFNKLLWVGFFFFKPVDHFWIWFCLGFFFLIFEENKILSLQCTGHMLSSTHCRYIAQNSAWNVRGGLKQSRIVSLQHAQRAPTDGEVVHVFVNLDTSPQLQPVIRRHLKYTKIKVKPANTFCLEIRPQCVLTGESIKRNQYCVSVKCSMPSVHQKMVDQKMGYFFSFLVYFHIYGMKIL